MQPIKSINVLVDNDSWILPYCEQFANWVKDRDVAVNFCRSQSELIQADVSFFLGCTQLVSPQQLQKVPLNLVVHESDLPKGKGFAPVAWQILEGRDRIQVCLIEADTKADSGRIWMRDQIELQGHELCDEWRTLQGEATLRLCQNFLLQYPEITPWEQQGKESFYARRTPADSELDPEKPLKELFDLLRVVDNERYPAFIEINNQKYQIKISKHHD